jgi:2-furoyl-CoA dehydrogenase 2Fe-2S iron sulfur subunit
MSDAPTPPPDAARVALRLNGAPHASEVEPRTLLSDFIRDQGLTGTKVGCEQGVCGACTVQVDGCEVRTVEGLHHGDLQRSFHEHHALQCGFCTAGFLMTLDAYLAEHPDPAEPELREALAGNLCRCTGYKPIIEAVLNL